MANQTNPSSTAQRELLLRNIKIWEGLHGRTLPPGAIDAWVTSFQRTKYELLQRALEMLTAEADRMPVPGMLKKAIAAARSEVQQPHAAESTTPHISELPTSVRQEMQRLFDETKKRLGITEMYPELKRRTTEQVEEDGRIARNRQKAAFADRRRGTEGNRDSIP